MGKQPKKSNVKKADATIIDTLLKLLAQEIPIFSQSKIFKTQIFAGSDEDHYTEILIKYLEEKEKGICDIFSIKPQIKQKGLRRCDIGFYLINDNEHYIFCMEAKFLPTKDYVHGNFAAIKRFKKNEHGISNFNPHLRYVLEKNAIVAYVKSLSFSTHLTNINDEITYLDSQYSIQKDKFQLNWKQSEKLQLSTLSNYISEHTRIDNSQLILYHFWVNI